jgi:hypothetical protein
VGRSKTTSEQAGLQRTFLGMVFVAIALPHCFHRFPKHEPRRTSALDEGGAGGEAGDAIITGPSGGSAGTFGSAGDGDGGSEASGAGGGASGSAGATGSLGGSGGNSGEMASGGGAGFAGSATGGSVASSGGAPSMGGAGAAGEGMGGGGQPAMKPQCDIEGSAPRVVLADDFEQYAVGAPYDQTGSFWVRAVEGRTGTVSTMSAYSGTQSFELASFTMSSEVAYATLALSGPPRRVVLELRYAPDGFTVYKDFAEFGLARAPSKFDLNPTVALEVNDHVLELRAAPEKPIASSNGQGPYDAAVKPPFVVLFDEVEYASDASVISYLRIDFDYCTDTVSAYVGQDEGAPLVGTGSFDGSVVPEAVYLAGGLNDTFVDDVRVLADD